MSTHFAKPVQGTTCASIALASIVLTSCTVGPNYQQPQISTAQTWVDVQPGMAGPTTAADTSVAVAEPADVREWWNGFSDQQLSSLIAQAAQSNLDLQQAAARIRAARAQRTIAGAPLWPSIDASADVSRRHTSTDENGRTVTQTSNLYRAGFDASWEIDVFGGTRRGVEAATSDLQAAIEDRRSILVSLLAEVATTYFDLRGQQQQLAIAQRNLESQKQSADLTRQRHLGGYVSQLDVANAEAQVATTTARIPALETAIRQSIYAISVLLGREPGSLIQELSSAEPLPPLPPLVPIGLPSDLLRRRPDIRLAEASLHAATARIGVATADLFPKFSLTGTLGLQGGTISALNTLANNFASIGPSVTWPVFAGGQIHANIDVQKALTDANYAAYQQAVLIALQDVENALIAYEKEQQRRDALLSAVESNQQAVDLATQLYRAGRTDFLNVLSAQGAQFSAEDAAAQSDTQLRTNLVALYKALGGGWDENDSIAQRAGASPPP